MIDREQVVFFILCLNFYEIIFLRTQGVWILVYEVALLSILKHIKSVLIWSFNQILRKYKIVFEITEIFFLTKRKSTCATNFLFANTKSDEKKIVIKWLYVVQMSRKLKEER